MRYLIDGDNLIGSWGGPRSGDDRRAEVVRHVNHVCRRLGSTATLVFDRVAGPLPDSDVVTTVVAASGETADDLVRAMVDAATDRDQLTVVTSDKPLYSYARTRGAHILRCHEWRLLGRDSD